MCILKLFSDKPRCRLKLSSTKAKHLRDHNIQQLVVCFIQQQGDHLTCLRVDGSLFLFFTKHARKYNQAATD